MGMMKFVFCAGLFLNTAISMAAEHGKAFASFALPKREDPFHAAAGNFITADGQLCLVGSTFVDSEARYYGTILVVDVNRKKTLWEKIIKPVEGDRDLTFAACMQQGEYIYVGANSTIYNANQSYTSIVKFDLQGRKIKSASLEIPGEQVFVRALGVVDKQMMAVGATQEIDEKLGIELYSVFLSKFDEPLKFSNKLIKKGGFQNGSSMRILESGMFVGGNFLQQKVKIGDGDVNDYANSRISWNGNYVWSTRPQPPKMNDVASAISDTGEVSSLSGSKNKSYLRTVDAAGKLSFKSDFDSKYCQTDQLVREGDFLYALRRVCDSSQRKLALLEIDVKSGKEREIKTLKYAPERIFFNHGHMVVLTKNGDEDLIIEYD
jgi:hypothetical protein